MVNSNFLTRGSHHRIQKSRPFFSDLGIVVVFPSVFGHIFPMPLHLVILLILIALFQRRHSNQAFIFGLFSIYWTNQLVIRTIFEQKKKLHFFFYENCLIATKTTHSKTSRVNTRLSSNDLRAEVIIRNRISGNTRIFFFFLVTEKKLLKWTFPDVNWRR